MMRLHVNIDHVATIRQARRTDEPDPVRAALLVEQGGAHGITVHLREDRRHIQDRDVRLLAETVRAGLNLEMATSPVMLDIAEALEPMAVTLVPERREEITTEGGLILEGETGERTRVAVDRLRAAGIKSSLFITPDETSIRRSAELNADAIELHTGRYANAWAPGRGAPGPLEELRQGAALGRSLGLAVHAGHGLTYENVTPVGGIQDIEELNIGHSIVSRAVFVGLERAVREMAVILREARAGT